MAHALGRARVGGPQAGHQAPALPSSSGGREIQLPWPFSLAHPPHSFLFGAHGHPGCQMCGAHPQVMDKGHRHFYFLDSSIAGKATRGGRWHPRWAVGAVSGPGPVLICEWQAWGPFL